LSQWNVLNSFRYYSPPCFLPFRRISYLIFEAHRKKKCFFPKCFYRQFHIGAWWTGGGVVKRECFLFCNMYKTYNNVDLLCTVFSDLLALVDWVGIYKRHFILKTREETGCFLDGWNLFLFFFIFFSFFRIKRKDKDAEEKRRGVYKI